jgi:hypothetical protein
MSLTGDNNYYMYYNNYIRPKDSMICEIHTSVLSKSIVLFVTLNPVNPEIYHNASLSLRQNPKNRSAYL